MKESTRAPRRRWLSVLSAAAVLMSMAAALTIPRVLAADTQEPTESMQLYDFANDSAIGKAAGTYTVADNTLTADSADKNPGIKFFINQKKDLSGYEYLEFDVWTNNAAAFSQGDVRLIAKEQANEGGSNKAQWDAATIYSLGIPADGWTHVKLPFSKATLAGAYDWKNFACITFLIGSVTEQGTTVKVKNLRVTSYRAVVEPEPTKSVPIHDFAGDSGIGKAAGTYTFADGVMNIEAGAGGTPIKFRINQALDLSMCEYLEFDVWTSDAKVFTAGDCRMAATDANDQAGNGVTWPMTAFSSLRIPANEWTHVKLPFTGTSQNAAFDWKNFKCLSWWETGAGAGTTVKFRNLNATRYSAVVEPEPEPTKSATIHDFADDSGIGRAAGIYTFADNIMSIVTKQGAPGVKFYINKALDLQWIEYVEFDVWTSNASMFSSGDCRMVASDGDNQGGNGVVWSAAYFKSLKIPANEWTHVKLPVAAASDNPAFKWANFKSLTWWETAAATDGADTVKFKNLTATRYTEWSGGGTDPEEPEEPDDTPDSQTLEDFDGVLHSGYKADKGFVFKNLFNNGGAAVENTAAYAGRLYYDWDDEYLYVYGLSSKKAGSLDFRLDPDPQTEFVGGDGLNQAACNKDSYVDDDGQTVVLGEMCIRVTAAGTLEKRTGGEKGKLLDDAGNIRTGKNEDGSLYFELRWPREWGGKTDEDNFRFAVNTGVPGGNLALKTNWTAYTGMTFVSFKEVKPDDRAPDGVKDDKYSDDRMVLLDKLYSHGGAQIVNLDGVEGKVYYAWDAKNIYLFIEASPNATMMDIKIDPDPLVKDKTPSAAANSKTCGESYIRVNADGTVENRSAGKPYAGDANHVKVVHTADTYRVECTWPREWNGVIDEDSFGFCVAVGVPDGSGYVVNLVNWNDYEGMTYIPLKTPEPVLDQTIFIDGHKDDGYYDSFSVALDKAFGADGGAVSNAQGVTGRVWYAWDENFVYLYAEAGKGAETVTFRVDTAPKNSAGGFAAGLDAPDRSDMLVTLDTATLAVTTTSADKGKQKLAADMAYVDARRDGDTVYLEMKWKRAWNGAADPDTFRFSADIGAQGYTVAAAADWAEYAGMKTVSYDSVPPEAEPDPEPGPDSEPETPDVPDTGETAAALLTACLGGAALAVCAGTRKRRAGR